MRKNKLFLILVLIWAVGFGVFSLTSDLMSKDIYRYIWDGYIASLGEDVYKIRPLDAVGRLTELPGVFEKLDWREEYTVYPPLAQKLFYLSYLAWEKAGIIGARLVLGLIPYLILAFWAIKRLGLGWGLVLVAHPLVIYELLNGGHIDGWMALFTVLPFGLGLAIFTKIYPVLFVPDLIFFRKNRVANILAILILGFIFRDSLVFFINRLPAFANNTAQHYYGSLFYFLPKVWLYFIFSLIFVLSIFKKRPEVAYMGYLLISSTVYPWYFILPLVVSIFKKDFVAILVISLLAGFYQIAYYPFTSISMEFWWMWRSGVVVLFSTYLFYRYSRVQ